MRSIAAQLATVLVAIIVIWALLKLLGLALKMAAILIVVALVVAVIFAAQKMIGKA